MYKYIVDGYLRGIVWSYILNYQSSFNSKCQMRKYIIHSENDISINKVIVQKASRIYETSQYGHLNNSEVLYRKAAKLLQ